MLSDVRTRAGHTLVELIAAVTIGALVAASSIALCSVGNVAVGKLLQRQWAWQEILASASLWATEVRGAGYDPSGMAGARVRVARSDTLAFSSDWNASGALLPTSGNPNERLEYVGAPGAWKRGVNGGPRLVLSRPFGMAFAYFDSLGGALGSPADPSSIRAFGAQLTISAGASPLVWTMALRAPPR